MQNNPETPANAESVGQPTSEAPLAAPTGSVWVELKDAVRGWRKAEMHHAAAVLQAAHPDRLRELQAAEDNALKRLRILVDREPWAEILHELTPNAELRDAGESGVD